MKFTIAYPVLCLAIAISAPHGASAQQSHKIVTYVSGNGGATEKDRQQGLDEAQQQAENNANSLCIGMVTATNTTSSGCIKIGSDDDAVYNCMVTVRARCEFDSH